MARKKLISLIIYLATITTILAALRPYLTPHMLWASGTYYLMLGGLLFRCTRGLHICLMSIAMLADLSLVLLLQFQRNAIETAVSFTLSPLQQAHVGASTIALLLYFPTLYYGIRRARSRDFSLEERQRHLRYGLTAFFFRTLGFLLMFSLVKSSAS